MRGNGDSSIEKLRVRVRAQHDTTHSQLPNPGSIAIGKIQLENKCGNGVVDRNYGEECDGDVNCDDASCVCAEGFYPSGTGGCVATTSVQLESHSQHFFALNGRMTQAPNNPLDSTLCPHNVQYYTYVDAEHETWFEFDTAHIKNSFVSLAFTVGDVASGTLYVSLGRSDFTVEVVDYEVREVTVGPGK